MSALPLFEPTTRRPPRWVLTVLLLLVTAGAVLRASGRNWDNGQGLHPDERFLMMVTEQLRMPPPDVSVFDATRSTLNPNVNGANLFVYGTLPVFLVGATYRLIGQPLQLSIYETGRTVTAIFDTATLALVAVLGVSLLGAAGAIFATAAYAFSVIPIQLSHFYTVDPYSAFFCLLTIAFALRAGATESRRTFRRSILGCGIAIGCAMASKASSAPIALVLPLALWVRDRRLHEGPGMLAEDRRGRWFRILAPTVGAALAAFVVFRFAQPYAFLGPSVFGLRMNPRWLENMREIQRLSIPGTGFPPNIQWWSRAPWFPLEQMFFWGLSPLVFIGALVGGIAVAWKNLRHDRWSALGILWVWCAVNFTMFGALAGVKYLRYQLPIYASACLLFGYAMTRLPISSLLSEARARLGTPWRVQALGTGYGILAVGTAVLWAIAFTSIYRAPVTRAEASSWILRHWAGPVNLLIQQADGVVNLEPVGMQGGFAPQNLDFRVHTAGDVGEILFHRIRATGAPTTTPPAPAANRRDLASTNNNVQRRPIRIELSRVESGTDAIRSTVFSGEIVFRDGEAENIRFAAEPKLRVREGELLRFRFELGSAARELQFEGTRILHETSWDDTLPLRQEGWDPYGGIYPGDGKLELYDPQLDRIVDAIVKADTLSISSNRVYGTIARMGRDYPLVDRFYRTLLECPKSRTVASCYRDAQEGNTVSPLGFRLEKTFTRNPTVGPITIPDQTAEEAFTVYDHPRVLLFRRDTRVPRAEVIRLLTTNYR